jgi:hypothetical protein
LVAITGAARELKRALSRLISVADSTHTSFLATPSRALLALMLGLLVAGALLRPALAQADGDPASDVLVSQPLFLPQDAGLTAGQQAELGAILVNAHRRGFALRVALIASPTDLGSVGALYRQPAGYAQFLDQELSLVFPGPLLVMMPNGFALAGHTGAGHPQLARALSGLSGAAPGPGFGRAAITAVRRLGAADGVPLSAAPARASQGTRSVDLGALVAVVLGAVMVAAAWAASLRARPLRLRPGSGASG